jgi:hypothetical protein
MQMSPDGTIAGAGISLHPGFSWRPIVTLGRGGLFDLGRSTVLYWLVSPPVTRRARPGLNSRRRCFLLELDIWGDAPSVFVVALSCYDSWSSGDRCVCWILES